MSVGDLEDIIVTKKPTYQELEQRVKELEKEVVERKRAEEALRESEESYKNFADSIVDVFFAMDRDLKYTYWNKASERLTGISAKDAVGKQILDIFPDNEETRRALEVYQEVLRTQQPQNFINEYHLGGKKYFFEISAYPSPNGLSVFVKDITEKKQAEETVRESEERLRQVVQNMPVMLDAFDEDNRILVWNRECERVTGYTAEEMIGASNVLKILYPDKKYLSRLLAEWAERGDEFYNWEMDITCKDGTVKAIAWSNISKRFPIPGWKSWAIGVDVSERKRAEEALRRERDMLQEALAKIKVLSEWYASYLRSL